MHQQWLHIVQMRMRVFVKRVSTDDNIADLPSRKVMIVHSLVAVSFVALQEFSLLASIGAQEVPPVLLETLSDAETWGVLQERWK